MSQNQPTLSPDNGEIDQDILSTYKRLSKIPFIDNGWIKPDTQSQLIVQYSQRDVHMNQKNKILRQFHEITDSFTYKPFSFGINLTNVVLLEPSPSWKYLALIRSVKKEGDKEEKYLIEIWDGFMIASIPTEGIHSHVYADVWFGGISWSPDENYIAYIAERNSLKSKSYFEKDANTSENLGSKYVYSEDWGETYKGGNPSIYVASILDEKIRRVPHIPDSISAGQVQWGTDCKEFIFTGWDTEPRRLGILHCYNRPSALYALPIDLESLFESNDSVEEEDKMIKLTTENSVSRSPRFSNDGKILVYLASNHTLTHGSTSKLMKMDWNTKKEETVIDIVEEYPLTGDDFPGLFVTNLPTRPFIDNNKIILSSHWKSTIRSLLIDLGTGSISKIYPPGCEKSNLNVKDVRQGQCALFECSEIDRIPFLFIGTWSTEKFNHWKCAPHSNFSSDLGIDVSDLEWKTSVAQLPDSKIGVEYILTLPPETDDNKKAPVILFPHGGPHSGSTTSFALSVAFFAKLGYAVIQVNYRGSTGYGQKYVDSLPGNCGTMDVNDCLLALKDALKNNEKYLDDQNLFVYGGSHGGFLTGHLISIDGVEFKASSMINAVTNMALCVGMSDIPDWCFVESGTTDYTPETLRIMFEKSPISRIHKVNTPTLIILGENDKRVPIPQSIEYYHKLKSNGVTTKMLKYPNEGHGIMEPEHEADYLINIAIWFKKYLKEVK